MSLCYTVKEIEYTLQLSCSFNFAFKFPHLGPLTCKFSIYLAMNSSGYLQRHAASSPPPTLAGFHLTKNKNKTKTDALPICP